MVADASLRLALGLVVLIPSVATFVTYSYLAYVRWIEPRLARCLL